MANSSINVTEGSGKRLDTYDRTISSVLVQDQFTLPGEYPYATYSIIASVSTNTADAHILQVMAGSSNHVRIRRIRIEQASNATAATTPTITLLRLTTAGTGGSAITPAKFDTADAAAGATAMTLPSSKGTESTALITTVILLRQAVSATQAQVDDAFEWTQHPGTKPIIIPAGTSNGVALKTSAGFGAVGSVIVYVEIVETAWL